MTYHTLSAISYRLSAAQSQLPQKRTEPAPAPQLRYLGQEGAQVTFPIVLQRFDLLLELA